jgi:hypothetical protein
VRKESPCGGTAANIPSFLLLRHESRPQHNGDLRLHMYWKPPLPARVRQCWDVASADNACTKWIDGLGLWRCVLCNRMELYSTGWSSAMDVATDSGAADRREGAASEERQAAAAAAAARSAVVSASGASVYAPPTNEYVSIALGVHMMLLCRRPSTAARSAGDGDTIATAACRQAAQTNAHTDNKKTSQRLLRRRPPCVDRESCMSRALVS